MLTKCSFFNQRALLIEAEIKQTLTEIISTPEELIKAASYALFTGGKRLRPQLALAVVECFQKDLKDVLRPIITLEFIHTYSIVHDDLPAMDNDHFRRGKPTLHRQFGEGEAILIGDFLLTFSFEVLTKSNLHPSLCTKLITLLSQAIGAEGMIAGQWKDIRQENQPLTLDELKEISRLKTGALFKVCCEFGAYLANAPPENIIYLQRFAESIGLAFQILDDLLDFIKPEKKKRYSDQENNKTTFLSYYTRDQAKNMIENLFQKSLQQLQHLECDIDPLVEMSKKLLMLDQ